MGHELRINYERIDLISIIFHFLFIHQVTDQCNTYNQVQLLRSRLLLLLIKFTLYSNPISPTVTFVGKIAEARNKNKVAPVYDR